MNVVRGWEGWPAGPLHLAFGAFDGFHRGHQALVSGLLSGARAAGAAAVLATFDVLPESVLRPDRAPPSLTSIAEKLELMQSAGVDAIVVWHFDEAFSRVAAEDFVARMLSAGDLRRMVVGPDIAFGHRRGGDVSLLRAMAERHGFAVEELAPERESEGEISSTRIRAALTDGQVVAATAMLGREYSVRGEVVRGQGRGTGLGFPTLNIATPPERMLPRDGIYAMRIRIGEEILPAAGSLGVRPTFEAAGERALEAYLIDSEREVHGRVVDACFVARIRDEEAFPSAERLREQMRRDVDAVRAVL